MVTRILLNDYAEGKITIGSQIVTPNGFSPEFEAQVVKAENDPSSKAFESPDDAISYLHNECDDNSS